MLSAFCQQGKSIFWKSPYFWSFHVLFVIYVSLQKIWSITVIIYWFLFICSWLCYWSIIWDFLNQNSSSNEKPDFLNVPIFLCSHRLILYNSFVFLPMRSTSLRKSNIRVFSFNILIRFNLVFKLMSLEKPSPLCICNFSLCINYNPLLGFSLSTRGLEDYIHRIIMFLYLEIFYIP